MTIAKDHSRHAKRLHRKLYNLGQKVINAENRRLALVEVGKTLVKTVTKAEDGTDVTTYDLPAEVETPSFNIPPAHAFVGGKMFKQSNMSRKNRPGEKILHGEAIVEDASRTFTNEVTKALALPAVDGVPVMSGTYEPSTNTQADPGPIPA